MENVSEKLETEKPYKSKRWIIGNIYSYIVGANLVIFVGYSILSRIIGFEKGMTVGTGTLLLSTVASVLAIKWGVESVFKNSAIRSQEIWKISLIVGVIPIIFSILFSAFSILTNLDKTAALSFYLIPTKLVELITAFISGLFYGIVTYIWFKKLSKRSHD